MTPIHARPLSRFLSALLLTLTAASLWAGPRSLVVVRPGGPTASEEATAQVSRLIVEIARRAGWDPTSVKATYFNRAADALAHIKALAARPGFELGDEDHSLIGPGRGYRPQRPLFSIL